ncbi:HNH endonuclease [Paenibacillus sp. P32E]|nr:HNH endonuclease [Paenibacillus sp. P32E]
MVPKGHAIIFGDGDRQNFDPNNLILITRGQLAIMNKRGRI